jgi:hypothetical protein
VTVVPTNNLDFQGLERLERLERFLLQAGKDVKLWPCDRHHPHGSER